LESPITTTTSTPAYFSSTARDGKKSVAKRGLTLSVILTAACIMTKAHLTRSQNIDGVRYRCCGTINRISWLSPIRENGALNQPSGISRDFPRRGTRRFFHGKGILDDRLRWELAS